MEIFLVGYGTLLHRGSLGHTIGHDSAGTKTIVPVTVRDYRRLFNLRPEHYTTSYKISTRPVENAAMNVEPAPGLEFNGLGFAVTLDELRALDQRERYYERRTAPLYHFDTGEIVGEGHFYAAAPDAPWLERDREKLMPLWRDIVWARTGAYGISPDFGRRFDETTYLADGETLVVERYRDVLHETDDVEMPGG